MHLLNSTKRARVTSNAIHLPGSRILHYVRFRYPINYDLVATRVPGDITYFEWHNSTGAVTLKRWFDKPIGYKFELMATATDLGPKNVTTSIIITLEVTYQLPIFDFGSGSGIISLEEGYNRFSVPIAKFYHSTKYYRSNSYSDRNEVIFFLLIRGRTEKTNKYGTFRAEQNGDDQRAVSIYLNKVLEYEKVSTDSTYTLTLQVHNLYKLLAEAQLTVSLIDLNNQAPIFTNVQSGKVFENEKAGTSVMTVSAVDNDATYPNNRVRYKISSSNPSYIKDLFEINQDTGLITTKTTDFDREEQAVYALTIDAEDGAPSSLLQNGQPNVTPQKFRIAIADKNDNAPYFPQSTYQAEVSDDQDVGSRVIQVRTVDLDTDASRTYYHIMSGDPGKSFKIAEQTGLIRVAKPLYYEGIKRYDLVVGAFDGQYSSDTNVVINILIKNQTNQAPIFTNVQSGKVFENEKAGTSVMTVSAVDYDATYPNNQVRYMISARNPLSIKDKFEINPNTGLITTKTAFDREEQAVYAVTIDAEDLQNSQHNVTSQKFRIAIADKNDNAPYFPQSTYQAEVSDDHDVGSRVIEVRALDLDTDASRTYYHIMSGDPGKAFKIEEQTGVIRLAKPLYYEGIKRYNLVVGALDGLYSSETNVVINILIKNQTNQAPIFTNVQSGKVFENEKAGTSVMTVSAVDYDATYPNNQVRYKISASNPSSIKDKFEINPNTGLITTKTAFDREEQAVYAVTIDAEDLQNSQPNVTSQKFRIAIADKNDNAPYFPQLTYQAEVPDDQDVGSRVIEVRALDLDTDASRTYYHIMSGDSGKAFKIEEQTGVIRVAKLLYYEGIKRYDLVVGASDGQYSSETNVVINILIKNQNNNVESGGNVLENE
jgi:hypothetical protein